MRRIVHDSVSELLQQLGEQSSKKMPYKVIDLDGNVKYVLAGNSDQAIAAVARVDGFKVEALSLHALMS